MTTVNSSINVSGVTTTGIQYIAGYSGTLINKKHNSFVRSFTTAVNEDILGSDFTKVSALFIKVVSGDLTVKLTTSAGTDQIITLDRVLYIETSTRTISNILISGTGEIEIMLSGE